MNVIIVGAGAQGAPCAAILARHPNVERVLLGATRAANAEAIRDRIGSPKVAAAPDTVERIEIRAGFHVPAQQAPIKTWMPTWSPE